MYEQMDFWNIVLSSTLQETDFETEISGVGKEREKQSYSAGEERPRQALKHGSLFRSAPKEERK